MPPKRFKVSLVYFVIFTLLLVGMVPLVLVGWFLSGRSATELRAVENRYQIQLVQEKARRIEMFGQRYRDMVTGLADAFALSTDPAIFSSPRTDQQLSTTLRENADLIALYVQPEGSESLSLYRSGNITRSDVDVVASSVLESIAPEGVTVGEPRVVGTQGEPILTIASPVTVGTHRTATVIAIVSLRRIARDVVGMEAIPESELWKSGLPIVFVVDSSGRTVFHPDGTLMRDRKPLSHLKIVDEWQRSFQQFQSGLVPFSADFDGKTHEMIGAYSTVSIGPDRQLGVVTMQDEARALVSVSEMINQTWLISLAFALLALLVGSIAARYLTAPLLKLSVAAEQIAGGDLTTRVETENITEIGTLGRSFNTMSDKLEEHIASLAKAAAENRELFVGTVKALAAAIDGKDKYTRGHSERVARISVAIGKQLALNKDDLETLRISALLHDVGKIAIDDSILKKPAALTDDEFEIMKTHPVKGYKIMSQIPAMKEFLPGMYMHHEMVNGKGYPQGLTGEQIPLQAKIVSVADTFDAMTIDRPYSKGMMLNDALDRIRQLVGTRYDGAVVEALVRGCNSGEIGRGVVQSMASIDRSGEKVVNVGVARALKTSYNPEDADQNGSSSAPNTVAAGSNLIS
jgi:HD-GYP domain